MVSALYYPHTSIRSTSLIRTALLLWDTIEYIVPRLPWRHPSFTDRQYTTALEMIGKPHVPTKAEKNTTHDSVKIFLEHGLPRSFYLSGRIYRPYTIYPDKFEAETWHLLSRFDLARWLNRYSDYGVSPHFGLLLMSLLADACAGSQKLKVTDRALAYAWLAENLTMKLGGQYVTGIDASQIGPMYDRLVTISIKVLNGDQISIRRLLAMRARELRRSGGEDYRQFRRRYLAAVSAYVTRIQSEAKTNRDVAEIERQFFIDMKDDLADLRSELGLARSKALLSKEVAVAVLAAAGSLAEPISGITNLPTTLDVIGVGALLKTGVQYRAARRKALREHAMSWLLLGRKRIWR